MHAVRTLSASLLTMRPDDLDPADRACVDRHTISAHGPSERAFGAIS